MRSVLIRAVCLLLLGAPLVAHADTTYNFQATGAGFESSGTLTVSPTGTGVYDITAITGEVDGTEITGLITGSYDASNPTWNSDSDFQFDNLFHNPAPYFDYFGIGIDVGTGGYQVNFYYDDSIGLGSYWFWDSNNNNFVLDSFTATPAVSATPEPSSLLLLGTGVLGFAGTLRRRLMA